MSYLSKTQTDFIRQDIRQRGITMSELEDDVLDYLCSSVEKEMEHQVDFEIAYQKVLQTLKPNELKMTQENTRDLLENRTSPLQKATYFALFALLFGVMGYMLFIPWASVVISIAILTLIILYVYSNIRWYIRPDGESKSEKGLILIAAAVIFLFVISIIFKLYHWPGGGYIMTISLGILVVLPSLMSVFFFIKGEAASTHVVMDIVKKNRKKVELILLAFFFLGYCARLLIINFLGNIFIITTLFCFAILFISYTWPVFTSSLHKGWKTSLLIASIVAYGLAIVTGLFKIMQWPFPFFNLAVNLPFILLSFMACIWYGVETFRRKNIQSLVLLLLSMVFFGYTLSLFGLISTFPSIQWIYNLAILILFVIVLVVFYKHQLFRVVAISLLGYYLLAFPYTLMPNESLIKTVYSDDSNFLELYEKSYQNPQNEKYLHQLLQYNEGKMAPPN